MVPYKGVHLEVRPCFRKRLIISDLLARRRGLCRGHLPHARSLIL